jgi:hypothetical protein
MLNQCFLCEDITISKVKAKAIEPLPINSCNLTGDLNLSTISGRFGGIFTVRNNPLLTGITFSSSNFDGNFSFSVNQLTDSNAVDTLYITGNIRTSLGRNIPIDIQDQYSVSTTPERSSNDTCVTYIPPVPPSTNNKKWKLTNDNLTTSIRWQALTSDAGAVIGGILTPGNFVGSTFYGGTYTCIRDNSLSYGTGGTVIIDNC